MIDAIYINGETNNLSTGDIEIYFFKSGFEKSNSEINAVAIFQELTLLESGTSIRLVLRKIFNRFNELH